MALNNPPSEYVCPISYELMTDPVSLDDGHTYERSAIEKWLSRNSISPITRAAANTSSLKPNYSLRTCIERWKSENTVAGATEIVTTRSRFTSDSFSARVTTSGTLLLECKGTTPFQGAAIIALIDQSGSMEELASIPSPSLEHSREVNGFFNRLDLAKQGVKTFARILEGVNGSLGVISFSDSAQTVYPMKCMDAITSVDAEKAVDALRGSGGSNLWDGLRIAFEMGENYARANPTTPLHIILLTDSDPTPHYEPVGGFSAALKRKLKKSDVRLHIHTIAVGDKANVPLLETICTAGGGAYMYIPEYSTIGPVCIDLVASILSMTVTHISIGDTEETVSILSGQLRSLGNGAWNIGETVKLTIHPSLKAAPSQEIEIKLEGVCIMEEGIDSDILSRIRKILSLVADSNTNLSDAKEELGKLATWLAQWSTPFAAAVHRHIKSGDNRNGILLKAIETMNTYEKWGKSYLIYYMRALNTQICINFEGDQSKFFQTGRFKEQFERGCNVYDTMHPAVMSYFTDAGYSSKNPIVSPGAVGSTAASAIRSTNPLSLFFNTNPVPGGCWDQWTAIRMNDGIYRHAKDIVAGDVLWRGYKVLAVVKMLVAGSVPMVRLSRGVIITPWHPVRRWDERTGWQFPGEVEGVTQKEELINFYYNMVLDKGHTVRLQGGWEACTLGHGFDDDAVIRHPYFGTGAVIEDLKRYKGLSEGLVVLKRECFRRDAVTGLVCGLTDAARQQI